MVQASTLRRRSWVDAAWLIVIVAAVLAALALGNTIVLLAALAAGLLSLWLLLRGSAPVQVASPPLTTHAAGVARAQRSVVMADSTPRQALIVHAEAADGYQSVLTIDGYALVNAEGRAVLMLHRQAPAPANEPVVVTIMDAEVVSD